MKFLFIVQGEGRGHMTQAIAFSKLLRTQGHQLCSVVLGKSKRRAIPDFFKREIQAPIHWIPSPNFECDANEKKISLSKTFRKNLIKTPLFLESLWEIHQLVKKHQPDVILNFYDILGGLYNGVFRPKTNYWVIGHQYLVTHSDFCFPKGRKLEKSLFQLNTEITAWRADERLALSFTPYEQEGNTRIVPPLLRPELKQLDIKQENFYLAYMVNSGYADEIIRFAQNNPTIEIKAYWDKKDAQEVEMIRPNLTFHQVNDRKFLQDMAACKGLVCTAGFESVCEAMYLGKAILVIPVAGQYEQACNALEVEKSQIGITATEFDFGLLENSKMESKRNPQEFRHWQNSWGLILQNLLAKEEIDWSASSPSLEVG